MKKSKKSNRLTPAEQSASFKEMAKQLGADERPEEFDKSLKRIALKRKTSTQKPPSS
jgi:hypothetical protein